MGRICGWSTLRTCIHNLKRRLSGRTFSSHTALHFLKIHKVFLQKCALPGGEIPCPSGISGGEHRASESSAPGISAGGRCFHLFRQQDPVVVQVAASSGPETAEQVVHRHALPFLA